MIMLGHNLSPRGSPPGIPAHPTFQHGFIRIRGQPFVGMAPCGYPPGWLLCFPGRFTVRGLAFAAVSPSRDGSCGSPARLAGFLGQAPPLCGPAASCLPVRRRLPNLCFAVEAPPPSVRSGTPIFGSIPQLSVPCCSLAPHHGCIAEFSPLDIRGFRRRSPRGLLFLRAGTGMLSTAHGPRPHGPHGPHGRRSWPKMSALEQHSAGGRIGERAPDRGSWSTALKLPQSTWNWCLGTP
jgi:hypothetical protein